ncbi:hypothetical protein ABZX93_22480 [Streptomyces sp. NPDC006632]|uniref:hypothetical protein n=1 Tax=Streptomyces sp. NPDC006632 TaxID=3157182 RepID=UPI0033A6C054
MIKRMGFFHDNAATASHLRDSVRPVGDPDEQRLIDYLRSGTEIYSTMGAEHDVVTGDERIAGSGSLVTDGTWLWPVELVHYLRRYHIALPHAFVEHVRGNGYTCPDVPPQTALAICDECFQAEDGHAAPPRPDAKGFVTWYVPCSPAESGGRLVGHLEASGLSAVHPLTEAAFGYRRTHDGLSKPLLGGREEVMACLIDTRNEEVTFQCWMGHDLSLTATVSRASQSVRKVAFEIPDTLGPEREKAFAALVRTLDQDKSRCLGFVVDRFGVARGQDWDHILLTAGAHLRVWPETLGIRRTLASAVDRLGASEPSEPSEPSEDGSLLVFHQPRTARTMARRGGTSGTDGSRAG